MSLTTESGVVRPENALAFDAGRDSDHAFFLESVAARVLTAAGHPQELLRRHGLAARRIALGRQILKIAAKTASV